MLPGMTALTARRSGTRATLRPDAVGPDLTLEARASGSQRIPGDLFVDMHGLGMLPQVIKTGESPGAVALERTFAGVLADMTG